LRCIWSEKESPGQKVAPGHCQPFCCKWRCRGLGLST
jgi:hypothetical protein